MFEVNAYYNCFSLLVSISYSLKLKLIEHGFFFIFMVYTYIIRLGLYKN